VSLQSPTLLSVTSFDVTGLTTSPVNIPAGLAGQTAAFQMVDQASCTVSNVLISTL
jgi:hypothetical protein